MAQMTVNGAELSYTDQGAGRPILLLHGWSMSGRFFRSQIEPLASEFRVVVPDYRGHGESAKVLSGHTVEQYAADVLELAGALGLERPVLVGWSMGAMIADQYSSSPATARSRGWYASTRARRTSSGPTTPRASSAPRTSRRPTSSCRQTNGPWRMSSST